MVFGKKKKVTEPKQEIPAVPDLVVDNPLAVPDIEQNVDTQPVEPQQSYVGMPGFVADAPAPAQPAPAQPAPVPVAQPAPATVAPTAQPVPQVQQPVAPEPAESFQIVGAELVGQGVYRYIILSNKKLGEVGEVYDY